MLRFKAFITEATLTASGDVANYHTGKYIKPYVGSENTHTVKGEVEGIDNSKPVTVHGNEIIGGKHHAIISQGGGPKKSVIYTKINKPKVSVNKGFEKEDQLVQHLKSHGLMPHEVKSAGAGAGTDFVLVNKKKNTTHPGSNPSPSEAFRGEVKKDKTAAFGQLTIHHTPEKGWHIKDKNRENRPKYAEYVQKHVISHLNKHHRDGNVSDISISHPDLKPAEAYLHDHHVDVVHISSHGTYAVGGDKTGIGLPTFKGTDGKFRARKKNKFAKENSLSVQFQPRSVKSLEKSHVHLENNDHIPKIKQALGVK